MAYSRTKKLTPAEKRLQTLRLQLYGKEKGEIFRTQIQTSTSVSLPHSTVDTSYLRRDLWKIAVLASLAITVELLLFAGVNRGLIYF